MTLKRYCWLHTVWGGRGVSLRPGPAPAPPARPLAPHLVVVQGVQGQGVALRRVDAQGGQQLKHLLLDHHVGCVQSCRGPERGEGGVSVGDPGIQARPPPRPFPHLCLPPPRTATLQPGTQGSRQTPGGALHPPTAHRVFSKLHHLPPASSPEPGKFRGAPCLARLRARHRGLYMQTGMARPGRGQTRMR